MFLKYIASVFPECIYFPPNDNILKTLGDIKSGLEIKKAPDRLSQLQYAAQIIFHLFTALPGGEIPQELQMLIGAIEITQTRTRGKNVYQL